MNTIHSVSNTSHMRSSEAVAVRNSFSFRSFMMRVMLVVAIVVGGKVAWGAEVTFTQTDFAGQGTSGSGSAMSVTTSDVTVYVSKGFGTDQIRVYSGSTLTVSVGSGVITKVVFTAASASYANLDNVTWSSKTGTWTGSSSSITFNATAQTRLTKIVVTYTPGSSHSLSSVVNPVGAGTVVLSSTTVAEGSTATAEATPNRGYAFDHWSISGTGARLSSTSANPTTVTMGTANATVTAHFTEVLHTVEFDYGTGKCSTFPAITELTESSANSGVVLPLALPHSYCTEYEFFGWATSEATGTSASPDIVGIAGDTYHPSGDLTLHAVYVSYSGNYTKVTANPTNWSGKYLIVYETGNKAFDGSLETLDVANNYIDVTITSSTIVSDVTIDASSFTIVQSGENCTIKSNSGYYIGRTANSNGLNSSTSTAYTNTISYTSIVASEGPSLKFNKNNDQLRFRYYASGQQSIQLYRKSATFDTNPSCPAPSSLTITYEPNGTNVTGSVTDDNTYGYNDPVIVLDGDGFVNDGYTFAGWNTAANGYGDDYDVGDIFYITENITLFAQWAPKVYSVTWYANGSAVESLPIHYGNSFLDEGYDSDGIAYIDDDADGNACDDMHIVGWYESEFEEFDGTPTLLQYDDIARAIATGNKNYYAVFAKRTGGSEVWNLVTDASSLHSGDVIVIASSSQGKVAGDISSQIMSAVSCSFSGSTITSLGDGAIRLTLEENLGEWTISNGNGEKLGATAAKKLAWDSGTMTWSISISDGEATIENTETSYGSFLYNVNNPRFTTYTSSPNAGMLLPQLYKLSGGYTYSDYTTFCPCDYDIDNISNGDMVWAGKNGETNGWNLASNWVVYRSSDSNYHLTNEAPTSGNVFIKLVNDGGGCIINVKPNLTSDVTCNNLKLDGIGIDIAENKTLTINSTATFTNGIINGNVIFGEDATATGASTDSHVDGIVTKNGTANGFTFPTGSNGNLGKVVVTDGTATNVSVQYFSNPAGFGTNDLPRWWNAADMSGENPFNHVSNVEYWRISSPEAITANFVAEASTDMHFNSETTVEDKIPVNIQMAFYDNNRWTNVGGTASIDGNTLSINGAEIPASATRGISGNYTTFGSKSKSTVLPIELISFTATCNGKSSLIGWTTATEKNNDFFVLERSNDAVNFKEIARVAGAGNSIEPINYAYTDYGARSGDNYYRLVQVDYDGTSTSSEIIVTNCPAETSGEPDVLAFPNPFDDNLTLHFENFGNVQATIEVYDMLGRMVQTQKVNCSQNDYEVVLRLAGLSDGTYNVRISTKEMVINRQVIKN